MPDGIFFFALSGMMIEENKPLDEVVFYDTGMEFEAIYKVRDKILPLLAEKGIKKAKFITATQNKDI